jgi:L-ribulose-5-phosphate 4-epimerase
MYLNTNNPGKPFPGKKVANYAYAGGDNQEKFGLSTCQVEILDLHQRRWDKRAMITGVKEGYYKFNPQQVGKVAHDPELLGSLNLWRDRLYELGLIGMYASGELKGVGYGNISARTSGGFLITATRTGSLVRLGAEHYTEIVGVDVDRNTVQFKAAAEGATPSAECMTHAMFYQADESVGAVIHVHHLEFWKRLLGRVPTTAAGVEYGTPDMAREIVRLYRTSDLPVRKLAVMAGHEEGVISIGRTLDEAGAVLLCAYESILSA